MGTKPDFAQKLLHDLRLRKERMVTAQNSDAFGNSRQILKGSRETRTLETALNQMVSYGSTHHSRQTGDFSMALAYAFDFTSNHAMIGFLQKIAKRSMQQSPNTQWQSSTNQFPTLTHLHIDEIAKGAQKLNQILRACSSDLNIDKGSIEMGKELWKGAMELEQSLKMLVSLQEASECMARPQRKSHLKLLEVGEDSEDESPISTKKQKQVERPVFSFDKASKSSKGSVKTGKQQKLMALTYLKEAPSSKPETVATTAKHTHRRSASCGPEFQSSQHINSRKMKHNKAKIPNVIAKLMGLDELAENVRTKVATESHTISKQRSGEVVSTKKAYGKGSAEVKIEHSKNVEMQGMQNGIGIQSNKITNMKSHQPEPQKEEYQMTYNYSYRTTIDPQKPRSSEEDREAPRNHLKESQEAIFQINERQWLR